MKLSKKSLYALRALLILANRSPASPVLTQHLASEGDIPQKFLEQILLLLKRGHLLTSKRGVGGGYQLAAPPENISLADVIQLVDGPLVGENAPSGADGTGFQGLRACLAELDQLILEFLKMETIASLLQREDPDAMLAIDI